MLLPIARREFKSALLARHALKLFMYSTTSKPPLQLVAQLRKLTDVPISKAREALSASGNNLEAALGWLQQDITTSGAQKAAKVAAREAREGLVSVCVLSSGGSSSTINSGGLRAAMIELNCETDFVARNDLFTQLAADIAHTAAFLSEHAHSPTFIQPCRLDILNEAPLLSQNKPNLQPSTVSSSVQDLIAKVGEKVSLKRAIAVVHDPLRDHSGTLGLRLASYLHGSSSGFQGRIGSLAVLALKSPNLANHLGSESFVQDAERLGRAIARQITGFETLSVQSARDETSLYNQPFMAAGGQMTVSAALREWGRERGMTKEGEEGGVEVLEFAKWTVGEDIL